MPDTLPGPRPEPSSDPVPDARASRRTDRAGDPARASHETPWVFGYGSLVNRATHEHRPARPAHLPGWRRAWRHTALRPVAFLTAVPDPDGPGIDGLIAPVPQADWLALDDREWAYERVRAERLATPEVPLAPPPDTWLYAIPQGRHGTPDRAHPVLLSYLDTVVQGYLQVFGADGADRFFTTTDGWDAPIADDRARPLYPRAQTLEAGEHALIDGWLSRLGCRLVPPPAFLPTRSPRP